MATLIAKKYGITAELKEVKILKGYWTDTSDKTLTKAILSETVRFHIETQGISDNETITIGIYDDDGAINPSDKIAENKIVIQENKGYVEIKLDKNWINHINDDFGNEIELYCECKYKKLMRKLPENSDDYLIVYEKIVQITIIIELPNSQFSKTSSDENERWAAKGLGGHTAIAIGEEFYDFGPAGDAMYSSGKPWWDQHAARKHSKSLEDIDLAEIKNHITSTPSINGEVHFVIIDVSEKDAKVLEDWWKNRYANLGNYSVYPWKGEQCTTTVRLSLESARIIQSSLSQTPQEFLAFLKTNGEHKAGARKCKRVESFLFKPESTP